VVLLPLAAFLALFFLPLFDRSPERRLAHRGAARSVAVVLAAGIGFLTTSAYLSTPVGAVEEAGRTLSAAQILGRTQYRQYCTGCHGERGEGTDFAPALTGPRTKDANWVHNYIEDPQRMSRTALMPRFLGPLSHTEVEQVTQYVLTLSPEPPS
jgi:mono/diheme cytochrome c family protein